MTIELTAVRVLSGDADIESALERAEDLEYAPPVDDETWDSMLELARRIVGPAVYSLQEDRESVAVEAAGPPMIEVLHHGHKVVNTSLLEHPFEDKRPFREAVRTAGR